MAISYDTKKIFIKRLMLYRNITYGGQCNVKFNESILTVPRNASFLLGIAMHIN